MFKGVTPDYRSQNPITFNKGEFFLAQYHLEEVCLRIKQENAKPIFLSRNIYDLVVSQYHHFRLDVDAEIDHSTSTTKFFEQFDKKDGLSIIINGSFSDEFTYPGLKHSIEQVMSFLDYADKYDCLLLDYGDLIGNKDQVIRRICKYLEIDISANMVKEIIEATSFDAMKLERKQQFGKGLHFRKGVSGEHSSELERIHYVMIASLITRDFPSLIERCEKHGLSAFAAV